MCTHTLFFAKSTQYDFYITIGGDLCALIKARQSSREQEMGSFFDSLEQKYASGGSSKTKSKKGGSASSKKATTKYSNSGQKTGKGKSRTKK